MVGDLNGIDVVINNLEHLMKDVGEIKSRVEILSKWQVEFAQMYVKGHTELEVCTRAAHSRLDDHEEDIKRMKDDIRDVCDKLAPIIQGHRVMVFIGGALGMSVLALIWSLITGRVELLLR